MILFIIFAIVVLLGITLLIILDNFDIGLNWAMENFLFAVGGIMTVFGSLAFSTSLIITIVVHCCENYYIDKSRMQYGGLVKRLEIINSDYEDVSKSEVIKNITEWNSAVYSNKHWAESKWTNWYNSKKYADSLEYIDIDKE